jgi:hypothetical protein
MPANHRVSVVWQIVFAFIPIVDLWAFYRIRKLRKYLLFVYAGQIAFMIIYLLAFDDSNSDTSIADTQYDNYSILAWFLPSIEFSYPEIISTTVSWLFLGFAIYLVIIWSRQHNRKFDTPAPSVEPPK